MASPPLLKEDVLAVVSRSFWAAFSSSASQVGCVRGGVHSGLISIRWDRPRVCAQHEEMNFV